MIKTSNQFESFMGHVEVGTSVIFISLASIILFVNLLPVFADWSFEPSSTIALEHGVVINFTDTANPPAYVGINQLLVHVYSNSDPTGINVPLYRWGTSNNFTSPLIIMTGSASDQQIPQLNVNSGGSSPHVTIANDTSITASIVISNPSFFWGKWNYFTNAKIDSNWGNCTTDNLGGDSDQDGICDNFENQDPTTGHPGKVIVTYPPSASNYEWNCGSDCPTIGQKDMLIEVDWMAGHEPFDTTLANVTAAFERAGIFLHIQKGEQTVDHMDTVGDGGYWRNPGTAQIKNEWFGTASERGSTPPVTGSWWDTDGWKQKKQVFHYALWIHDQAGSIGESGSAEIKGNDVIISLGSFDGKIGSHDQQDGTFLHELGHNTGLNHGGQWDDTINCKPNYISIMSYSRQFSDILPTRTLDFSFKQLGTKTGPGADSYIDENILVNTEGISSYSPNPEQPIVYGDSTGQLHFSQTGVDSITWPGTSNDISYIVDNGEIVCNLSGNEKLFGFDDKNYFETTLLDFRSDNNWAGGRTNLALESQITILAGKGASSNGTCTPSSNCSNAKFVELPYQGYMNQTGYAKYNSTTITWNNQDTINREIYFDFTSFNNLNPNTFMITVPANGSFVQPFHESGKFKYRDGIYGDEGLISVGNNCLTEAEVLKYGLSPDSIRFCASSELDIEDVITMRLQRVAAIENELLSLNSSDYVTSANFVSARDSHLSKLSEIREAIGKHQSFQSTLHLSDLSENIGDTIKPTSSQGLLDLVVDTRLAHSKAAAAGQAHLVTFDKLPGPPTSVPPLSCGHGTELVGTECILDDKACGPGTKYDSMEGTCKATTGGGIDLGVLYAIVGAIVGLGAALGAAAYRIHKLNNLQSKSP